MNDAIKVIRPNETQEQWVYLSQFKEVMGVEYAKELRFRTPQLQRTVEERCHRAHRNGKLRHKQLWTGCYYAHDILSGKEPDVTITWIDQTVGYGVWTNQDIPAHTYVGEYTGVLRRPHFFKDKQNYYCFNYYITMGFWEQNLWAPYLVDAKDVGNFTRYINHSSCPNLGMASAYCNQALHIIFYANSFIPKGSQLLYDYGPTYWEKRQPPLLLINSE